MCRIAAPIEVDENGQQQPLASVSIPETPRNVTITYKTQDPKENARVEEYLVSFDYHS